MSDVTNAPVDPKQLKKWAEEQILWHYLQTDDNGNFTNPPKTDDELHEFIRLALGVTLPRKIITPGHKTAFHFISDLYFERVKSALGFANRAGGKTFGVAILNFLDLLFKPGCEIASAGATLDQANKCYGYLQGFLELPWFTKFCDIYQEKTGKRFLVKEIQACTELANGAKAQIITGTDKGLRGPHPNKARIDEIDLIEWDTFMTGMSMAQSRQDEDGNVLIRGQNTFTSTRQVPNGTMQRLIDEAKQKGIEIYQWDIWEALQKCKRQCKGDPVHGDCPIFEFCQGKAHECEGFFPIDDFIDKVRLIDKEEFETEWLNHKPQRGKLIYPMFDPVKHVISRDQLKLLSGKSFPTKEWDIVSAIDFGSSPGHPFVYLKGAKIPGKGYWVIFHEYVAEQDLLRNHASHIKSSPLFRPGETIVADHDAQDRLELAALGVATRQADKDVDMGIDLVKTYLNGLPPTFQPMLYIMDHCKHLIWELSNYSRKTRADGSIDPSGKPEKRNDDAADALRYLVFTSRNRSNWRYRTRRMEGI
jgi:hypothetical protein